MNSFPVRAKKYLGQHFLRDQNVAAKIVDSLDIQSSDFVLEVGPGTGVLTALLKQRTGNLQLVEVDAESVAFLKRRFPELEQEIIQEDFLKYRFSEDIPESIFLIGNFPYNISSQIFFRILENRQRIQRVVCMVQKEVAQRIAAPPGSKVYGILSVLLQAFYKIDYLFTVSEHVFEPPPNVKSAVIRLDRNERKDLQCNEELFFRVIKTAFNQRRKVLRNSLKPLMMTLPDDEELLGKRPEQLGVEKFIGLTRALEETNH
jgi:16S rRNA (adenine1518-N6/adenine1519-N6)-dimethyltransferase